MTSRAAKQCATHAGKRRYNSGAAARRAIENIRDYGDRRDSRPQRAYPCDSCGKWFLTSSPERT